MDSIACLPVRRGTLEIDGRGMQEFVHNATGEGFEHTTLPLIQWSELVQGFLEFLPMFGGCTVVGIIGVVALYREGKDTTTKS